MSIKAIPNIMIDKVLSIVVNSAVSQKDKISIDICFDMFSKPMIENLSNYYSLKQYIAPNGKSTDTFYINKPDMLLVDRVVIYNKQYKNKLQSKMYRLEATIPVYNLHLLYLPLDDILKELINLIYQPKSHI